MDHRDPAEFYTGIVVEAYARLKAESFDPEPYLRAARLLGLAAGDCVAVEDSPVGTASAEGAGCTVVVVEADVPVEPGTRRTFRSSLVGVDAAEFARIHRTR